MKSKSNNPDLNIGHIVKMIRSARADMQRGLEIVRSQIDYLISNNKGTPDDIEHRLDFLLDCAYLGLGEEDFKRLNAYYATISPENAARYDEFYKDATQP